MSDPELINCLHCGNEAKFISISGGTLWMACCPACKIATLGCTTKQEAADTWNKIFKNNTK